MDENNNVSGDALREWNGSTIGVVSSTNDAELSDSKLAAVAARMAREIALKNRVHRLREYKCCFKGIHAVRWMLNNGICHSIQQGVHYGNRLREMGYIRHVTNTHIFCNKDYLYWFHDSLLDRYRRRPQSDRPLGEDGPLNREMCCQSSSSSYLSLLGLRGTAAADDHDVGNELIQLQRRVYSMNSDLRSRVYEARSDIGELIRRMEEVEEKLAVDGLQQKWMTSFNIFGFGLMFFIFDSPLFNWLTSLVGLLAIIYSIISMQRTSSFKHSIVKSNKTLKTIRTLNHYSMSSIGETSEGMSSQEESHGASVELTPGHFINRSDVDVLWINTDAPATFETEIFDGAAVLWVRGLPSAPPGLFKVTPFPSGFGMGRLRGERVSIDRGSGGRVALLSKFSRPLKRLPAEFLLNALFSIVKSMNPSARQQLKPYPEFLSNLIATAQAVNVSKPGTEPSMQETIEDMRVISDRFKTANGSPLSSLARKRLMGQACQRGSLEFDTEHVWTFHFWQHMIDVSAFQLDMTIKRFDLVQHLNGQPMALMARTESGQVLWNFELWHRDLL